MALGKEIKFFGIKNITEATVKDSLWCVKADNENEFKLYVTDLDGNLISLKDLTGGGSGGGISNITSTDGSILVTGGTTRNLQVSGALQTIINSALQSGDNLSSLLNDAGYITVADIPLFDPSLYDLTDFNNGSIDPYIKTSQLSTVALTNDYLDLENLPPAFNPANYDLTEFTNTDADPFARVSELGSGGVTNLSSSQTPATVVIASDTGTDATISLADTTNAGVLSPTDKVKLNNTSNTNSGDQTSIVGITGTKAQFDLAVTDGDILYVGDVTQYNDELAQDAVANILTGTPTINFSYNDVFNTISADVKINSITASQLSNSINISEFINDSSFENTFQLNIRDINNRARANHTGTQVATTISDFTTATKIAVIDDFITDGVTDKAPSQNAVFDALASKYDASNPSGYISDVNLAYTPSATNGIIVNDKGVDATIPLADATNAGLITPAEKSSIATAVQPATLTNYIPYTGATTNVDLGEFQIKVGQLEFDTTPTGTFTEGKVRWNDSDGTIEVRLKGGNVTLQLGQEQVLRVVNKTGVNLLESQYKCAYISGAIGNRLKIDLALSNNSINSSKTVGLVTEDINNNLEGFITTSGLVRGINTTGSLQSETWADGDILYLSATISGGITNILPVSPNHKVLVGYVVNSHITQGAIFVKVDVGLSLQELHNVHVVGTTVGKVLGSSTEGLWENKSVSDVLGYTPENTANKSTSIADSASSIKFPVWSAAVSYVTSAISGFVSKASNLSDLISVKIARVNLGIDSITNIGNSNYTILSTDKTVATSVAFTAPRTWTLPSPSSANAGYEIIVSDLFGSVSNTNTLTVLGAINGGSSVVMGAQFGARRFTTDGVSKWTVDAGVMRVSDYIGTALTANKVIVSDSNNKFAPSPTTTTQLGYLSGATGTTGIISTNIVYSNSPALTGTPTVTGTLAVTGTSTSGISTPYTVVGGTGTSAGGWKAGGLDANNGVLYSNAVVTPSSSNFTLLANATKTEINATTTVNIDINGSAITSYNSAGVIMTAGKSFTNGIGSATVSPQLFQAGTLRSTITAFSKEANASGTYQTNSALNRFPDNGKIFGTTTDNSNVGITESDLVSYTTKVNTLVATDESLYFDIAGTFNDITSTAQLQFYFGGVSIGNTGVLTISSLGGWSARIIIIRSGTTTAKAVVTVTTPGASTAQYTTVTSLTGITFTNTNIIKCTGISGGASGGSGDITMSLAQLTWMGASNN